VGLSGNAVSVVNPMLAISGRVGISVRMYPMAGLMPRRNAETKGKERLGGAEGRNGKQPVICAEFVGLSFSRRMGRISEMQRDISVSSFWYTERLIACVGRSGGDRGDERNISVIDTQWIRLYIEYTGG
jgi:hypothetical protein